MKNRVYRICACLMLTSSLMVSCFKGYNAGSVSAAQPPFGGWVTYWEFDGGLNIVKDNAARFSDVYFFAAVLTAEGKPFIYQPGQPYAAATVDLKSKGIRSWLTVVNDVVDKNKDTTTLKDPVTVQLILHNPVLLKQHIQDLVDLVLFYGFEGVDVDYENLFYDDRHAFTRFIEQLNSALKVHNLALSVTVQPKTADHTGRGAGAMDWRALCNASDQLQVMLYNLHSGKTGPGPLASTAWINDVMAFAISQCPKNKIVPVLKTSGIRWNDTEAKDLNHLEIKQLATEHADKVQRTPDGTPYIAYTQNNQQNILYFEDPLSLNYKISALQIRGLHRISLWRLSQVGYSPHEYTLPPEGLRFRNQIKTMDKLP